MKTIIIFAAAGIALIVFITGCIQSLLRDLSNERCRTCGYLIDGPLHDDNRCEAERTARNLTEGQIRGRKVFRMNKDKLGF